MQKLANLLILVFSGLMIMTVSSCNTDCDCSSELDKQKTELESMSSSLLNRGTSDQNEVFRKQLVASVQNELQQLAAVPSFEFKQEMLPEGVNLSDIALISEMGASEAEKQQSNAQAAELVYSIYNSLLVAENKAAQLEVDFSMSNEPVDNGMFVFSIGTEEPQTLTLEMFDEEGFELQAQNSFSINKGDNYKALNVSSLEAGSYLFRLKNEEAGKELMRKIEIAK